MKQMKNYLELVGVVLVLSFIMFGCGVLGARYLSAKRAEQDLKSIERIAENTVAFGVNVSPDAARSTLYTAIAKLDFIESSNDDVIRSVKEWRAFFSNVLDAFDAGETLQIPAPNRVQSYWIDFLVQYKQVKETRAQKLAWFTKIYAWKAKYEKERKRFASAMSKARAISSYSYCVPETAELEYGISVRQSLINQLDSIQTPTEYLPLLNKIHAMAEHGMQAAIYYVKLADTLASSPLWIDDPWAKTYKSKADHYNDLVDSEWPEVWHAVNEARHKLDNLFVICVK